MPQPSSDLTIKSVETFVTDKFREQLALLKTAATLKEGDLLVPQTAGLGGEVDDAAVKRAVVIQGYSVFQLVEE
jgi:hypothetical protein